MTKRDIAEEIAKRASIPHREAGALLEAVLTLIKTTLHSGEPVAVAEFGTFRIRSKAARRGRNPRTGEPVTIEGRRVVTFRASPKLKAAANASGHHTAPRQDDIAHTAEATLPQSR